jgi:hypothetical protein
MNVSLWTAWLFALSTSAIAKPEPIIGSRIHPSDEPAPTIAFKVGADRQTVLHVLGLPNERVGDYLWIYRDFKINREVAAAKGCDTLVVAFQRDRVVATKLTDGDVLRATLAQSKLKPTGPSYADLLR